MQNNDSKDDGSRIDRLKEEVSLKEKQLNLLKHTIDSQRLDFTLKQQKLTENARQLYTLLRVSTNVSQTDDLNLQLNFIAQGIVESNLSERVIISTIDETWHRQAIASSGFTNQEFSVIKDAKQLSSKNWQKLFSAIYRVGYNTYYVSEDDSLAPEIYNLSDLTGESGAFLGGDFLIIPLRNSVKQLIGTIITNGESKNKTPNDAELHLLEIFAREASSAIDKNLMHQQLIYDENLLKQLIQCSTDIIVSTNANGEIEIFNSGAENILGYKASEIRNQSIKTLYRKHDEARKNLRIMRNGSGFIKDFEIELKTKSGDTIPVSFSAVLLVDKNDVEIGTIGIGKDLRDIKKLDAHLKSCHINRIDKKTLSQLTHKFSEPIQGIELTLQRIIQMTQECEKQGGIVNITADLKIVKKLFDNIYSLAQDLSSNEIIAQSQNLAPIVFEKQYKILIVDDDSIVRQGFVDLYQKNGLLPQQASSVAQAKEMINKNDYDLILTDIVFPEDDGYSIYRYVKNSNPNIPVILITGYGYDPSHTIIRAAKDISTRIFFKEKPINPQNLLQITFDALTKEFKR